MSDKDAETWARQFHEAYERLAPSFGYETRADTKAFDPTSPNGRLMTAVCGEVCSALIAAAERADAAERKVVELEEALKEIGRCDLGPSSADHLIGFRAAALARTALGKEPRRRRTASEH